MKTALSLCIVFLLCLSGGCKKEPAPAKKPTAEKAQPAPSEAIAKAEEAKVEFETYQYDAKGRRDPFLSLVAKETQKPIRKRGATPFESYEIDEMQLVAIAWDKNRYYALIKMPDNKAFTVTEGMTLGLQGGKVHKITKDSVHIREYVKDYKGDIKPRDAILKLHKGEE